MKVSILQKNVNVRTFWHILGISGNIYFRRSVLGVIRIVRDILGGGGKGQCHHISQGRGRRGDIFFHNRMTAFWVFLLV
jgi:hypothetical protein